MIDFYYEIKDGTTVFGQTVKYLARYEFHPGEATASDFKIHDEAVKNSTRVWLQNSNGLAQVMDQGRNICSPADEKEFSWIKLQARDIEKI